MEFLIDSLSLSLSLLREDDQIYQEALKNIENKNQRGRGGESCGATRKRKAGIIRSALGGRVERALVIFRRNYAS